MDRTFRIGLVFALGVCLHSQVSQACRYNVRDVGFVDLGMQPYYLFAYVDQDTPKEVKSDIEEVMAAALADTIAWGEIVDVNDMDEHPAMELVEKHKIESFPAFVFLSPEGRSRLIEASGSGDQIKEQLTSQLETIFDSPKRQEILEHVADSYGVVLLIEGKDAEENKAATQAAKAAIEAITAHMDYLPKPIEKGPVLVTLDQKSFAAEEILFWCLGLEAPRIERPVVIMIYGRMRRLGPALAGEDLTEDIIANILSIIGADCECGLDRRWMQGTMMPVKWNAELQAKLVKSLGFDPENPMVKMEISMILRKGGGMAPGGYGNMNVADFGGVPFGYQEIEIEFDDEQEPNEPEAVETAVEAAAETGPETVQVEPVAAETVVTPPAESVEEPVAVASGAPLKMMVMIVFGVCVMVIAVGVLILLRGNRWN